MVPISPPVKCGLWSIVLAFPIASVLGLVFRFPIPFGGYLSGPRAMLPSLFAVMFYGLFLGLFPAIVICGYFAGSQLVHGEKHGGFLPSRIELWASVLGALVPLLVLSALDKIIGPW